MDPSVGDVIAAVSAALGRPATAITLRETRPLPGGWCIGADLHAGDGAVVGAAWAAQIDGDAPPGTTAVDHDSGRIGIWEYPHDPELPGLAAAVTPGALRDLLPGIDHGAVTAISLTPLARAVVRIGRPGHAVYVKVLPPADLTEMAETTISIHDRLRADGVPAAEVVTVDRERGLIAIAELPGTPLTVHLETGGALPIAAELWELIERLAAVPIDRPSPAPALRTSFLGATDRLGEMRADLVDPLHRLAERIPAHGSTATRMATIHGDLHGRQLLVDHRGHIVGIVDLDDVGRGDLYDDLGRLVAHLAVRSVTHGAQRHAVDALVGDFLLNTPRTMDATEITRRAAMAMVLLASAAEGVPEQARPADPGRIVDAAIALLAETPWADDPY